MGFSSFQRIILTISAGKFATPFPKLVLFFLMLIFCFVHGSFASLLGAAESTWQTVVGENEIGNSPATPPGGGNTPSAGLTSEAFHVWFAVSPAVPGTPLRAGSRATIEVKIQGPVERIGRVDIEIDGDGPYIASAKNRGHYAYYWEIPQTPGKQVKIVFRARAKTGNRVLLSSFKLITIQPAAMAFKARWKTLPGGIRLKESKKAVVEVVGGTAPYTYNWKIFDNKKTISSLSISSDKLFCEYQIGPFEDPEMIFKTINFVVEVKDLEGTVSVIDGFTRVLPSELLASFSYPPNRVRAGERQQWWIEIYDNGLAPYNVEFVWGDKTPSTKVYTKKIFIRDSMSVFAEHVYSKSAKYTIKVTVKDRSGSKVEIASDIEVTPATLDIIEFIGPEKAQVGKPTTFKVKIKPGLESKPPYKYTFSYGDYISESKSREAVEVETTHYYYAAKIYPVSVRVEDNCGFDESEIKVTVSE